MRVQWASRWLARRAKGMPRSACCRSSGTRARREHTWRETCGFASGRGSRFHCRPCGQRAIGPDSSRAGRCACARETPTQPRKQRCRRSPLRTAAPFYRAGWLRIRLRHPYQFFQHPFLRPHLLWCKPSVSLLSVSPFGSWPRFQKLVSAFRWVRWLAKESLLSPAVDVLGSTCDL